jgi:hypothetical protein
MALNKKLTPILAGRTIKSIEQADNLLSVHFADGSIMKIKTSAPATPAAIGMLKDHTVESIRQKGATLTLVFNDATSALIALAEATSSVMLRDGKGVMEYAD